MWPVCSFDVYDYVDDYVGDATKTSSFFSSANKRTSLSGFHARCLVPAALVHVKDMGVLQQQQQAGAAAVGHVQR